MAKHIKLNKNRARLITISVIMCVLAVALACIKMASTVPFYIEKQESVVIRNSDELLRHKDSIYNDECVLAGDVTVTDPDICFGGLDRVFEGSFDGNGHTVYVNLSGNADGFSLFGRVAEGAVIKNVNFVFGEFDVSSRSYGGVATCNEGTISNCTVSFSAGLTRTGTFSPFVTTNRGEINNIVADGVFVNRGIDDAAEDKVFTGAVCVYNYGTLKNAVVTVDYKDFNCTSKLEVLNGNKVNATLAAVRLCDVGIGETSNVNVLISDTLFAADHSESFYPSDDKAKVFNENNLFVVLDFDNRFWQLDGYELTLIKGDG